MCDYWNTRTDDPTGSWPQTMFSLFIVKNDIQNTPPVLTTTNFVMDSGSLLSEYLEYEDAEKDQVVFEMARGPTYGRGNVSLDGLLQYTPRPYFFGQDSVDVRLREIFTDTQGHSVVYTITILVSEIPFAPVLYYGQDEDNTGEMRLLTGTVTVQFEGNQTTKELGNIMVCDFNPKDRLGLIYQYTDREHVEVHITETSLSEDVPSYAQKCFNSNYKIYKCSLTTTKEYFGSMAIVFIANDSYTYYSQPLEVEVYTLISPCIHGHCTSPDDPYCTSNSRSESFNGYGCSCDAFHKGEWCEGINVASIMGIVGLVAILVAAVIAITVVKKR